MSLSGDNSGIGLDPNSLGKGLWQSTVDYEPYDLVRYNGMPYIATGPVTTGDLPSNSNNWVTIPGTASLDGTDGADGNSFLLIYIRDSNPPAQPSGGTYADPSAGTGWSLTIPSGSNNLYGCVVEKYGDGTTFTYSVPFNMSGPKGLDGISPPAPKNGQGLTTIYRRSNGNLSARPTGGSYDGTTITPPANWSLDIPSTSEGSRLFASDLTLDNNSNSISNYTLPYRKNANPPPTPQDGRDGKAGEGLARIYRRSNTDLTVAPTGATYNGTVVTPPSGWSLDIPAESLGDKLFASDLQLNPNSNTVTSTSLPFQLNGDQGDSYARIYRKSTTDLTGVPTGSTYNGSIVIPPSGWSTTAPTLVTGEKLFASDLVIDHVNNSVKSTSEIFQLNGNEGDDGDAFRLITRRSTTDLSGVRPTGASWTRAGVFTPPSGWSLGTAPGSDDLYGCVIQRFGETDTIRIDFPFKMTGEIGGIGPIGPTGEFFRPLMIRRSGSTPPAPQGLTIDSSGIFTNLTSSGPDGLIWDDQVPSGNAALYWQIVKIDIVNTTITNISTPFLMSDPSTSGGGGTGTGVTGAKGDSQRLVFGRFASAVTPTAPTGLGFNSGRITGVGSGNDGTSWNDDVPSPQGANTVLWGLPVEISNEHDTVHVVSSPFRMGGGEPGADGDSIDFIFRRDTSIPSTPTGGTWDGTNYNAPAGWFASIPSGSDPLYVTLVKLSGKDSTNTGITYEAPIKISPTNGIDGAKGNSVRSLYLRKSTTPLSPIGLTINSSGIFQNLRSTRPAPNNDLWSILNPSGSDPLYKQDVELDFQLSTLTILGPPYSGGGQIGNDGADGNSIDLIYRRSTVRPSNPTGGTATNGRITTLPSNWSLTVPTGSDPLYVSVVRINGETQAITYDEPERFSGITGLDGIDGDSLDLLYRRSSTQPTLPSGGSATDGRLSTLPSGWSRQVPSGSEPLYISIVHVDGATQTITYDEPSRLSGITGLDGADGNSIDLVYRKSSTRPTLPSGGSATNGRIATLPSGWSRQIPSGNDPLYVSVAHINGETQAITYDEPSRMSALDGTAGDNGQSILEIYRSSASTPTDPATGSIATAADPNSYTAPADWSLSIPSRTMTADIYRAIVTIPRTGTTPTITRALFLEARLSTPPVSPPTQMSYSDGIEYGISAGNTPSSTHLDSAAFSLAIGESHTTELLTFPVTTTTNDDFYIRLPTGLTLTNAIESVDGEEFSNWNKVTGQNVWIYTIGFEDSQNSFTFTIRRDS